MKQTGHGMERGATLVELLVSTVILLIITGALTEAIIVGLRTNDRSATRVSTATDAQLLSSYFGTDVQSALAVHVLPQLRPGVAVGPGFQDPAKAKEIDGTGATLSAAAAATITLGNFGLPGAVGTTTFPPGARIEQAVLRVVHREDPDTVVSATVRPPGAVAPIPITQVDCAVDAGLCRHDEFLEDRVELATLDGLDPEALFTPPGLEVDFTVTPGGSSELTSIQLDGVVLEISYSAPRTLTAQTVFPHMVDGTGPATLEGFGTGHTTVPPGSAVTGAVLRVRHTDTDVQSLTVTLNDRLGNPLAQIGNGVEPCDHNVALCVNTGVDTTDVIDLVAILVPDRDTAGRLDGMEISYEVVGGPGSPLSRIDGIELEIRSTAGCGPGVPVLTLTGVDPLDDDAPTATSYAVVEDPEGRDGQQHMVRSWCKQDQQAPGAAVLSLAMQQQVVTQLLDGVNPVAVAFAGCPEDVVESLCLRPGTVTMVVRGADGDPYELSGSRRSP